MDADERDDLFGRISLEREYITEEELEDALEAMRHLKELGITDRTLDEIMVQKGYISEFEKKEILSQLEKGAEAGATVHGYQVLLELEHDGPGTLYKAYQRSMDRTVLLRVLSKENPEEAALIPLLKREARLVARLQHPGIVAGYDAGETESEYFLVSEFVEGIKLSQLVELEGSLGEEETLKIALKIARSLEYFQEQGIIHRDVEPENIIVTKTGEAKIASCSLAVSLSELPEYSDENTSTATPFFVSPEQAKGFEDLDIRSDLFSLGATMYFMLTGQAPFGNDPEMVSAMIITKETPDPRTLELEITPLTAELVMKLMNKEKEERYPDCAEVRKRIEELMVVSGLTDLQPKPRKLPRTRRGRVKHASKMLQASASKPVKQPETAQPKKEKVDKAPSQEGLKARAEAVKQRSVSSVSTAVPGRRHNTAIYAIAAVALAIIIIIAVLSNLPAPKPDIPEPQPRETSVPNERQEPGPRVSDVQGGDIYPEDVKKFKELKKKQMESPASADLITEYAGFIENVRDPDIKRAALEARDAVVSNFYKASIENAEKLRTSNKYSQAISIYEKMLAVIPEVHEVPREQVAGNIDRTMAESDAHFTSESSRAEGLLDRGNVDEALAIYERLRKDSVKENSELAEKVVQRLRRLREEGDVPVEPAEPEKVGEGPDMRTPEEIEAQEKERKAQAMLDALKNRIVSEVRAKIVDHVASLRIPMAKRTLEKALENNDDEKVLAQLKKISAHLDEIDRCMKALEACMEKLYKKNIIELWLKKRQVLLGELIRYESGTIILKKRNNETVKIRLTDLREDEVERYLLDGFGEKTAENYLSMAVFFVYFYGEHELTRKYLGLAKAEGTEIAEYVNLLKNAGFESALMEAEEDIEKKRFFEAYMKLCRLVSDYRQSDQFQAREAHVSGLRDEAFASSGLGRLFAGKLGCRPPFYEVFYDFIHSSQLNDFKPITWDAGGEKPADETWRLEDDTLAGGGDAALVWKGLAEGEVAVSFFAEPRELGFFEVLIFADPEKPFSNEAYAFGFHAMVEEMGEESGPEHYIALWDGKKESYEYLKRGIMKPVLEEESTRLVQIIVRKGVLQLFIDEELLGEIKDSRLESGTVVLRVKDSLIRFDNLEIKAGIDESWLRKAAREAK